MMPVRPTVVYIAGSGRSGSTLLARLLGEIPGFVNVGEAAAYLFNPRLRSRDVPCGCGATIASCAFWSGIVATIEPESEHFAARFARLRHLPLFLAPWAPRRFRAMTARFLEALEDFYAAIAAASAATVIVDSSKNPTIAKILAPSIRIDRRLVHLVRDPRAVVASWSRPKEYLEESSPLKSTLSWIGHNAFADLLGSSGGGYVRIRYEDFVMDPRAGVDRILADLPAAPRPGPEFLRGSEWRFGRQHMVCGNPDKLADGPVRILRRDAKLAPVADALVSLATLPWLVRYGYEVRPHPVA